MKATLPLLVSLSLAACAAPAPRAEPAVGAGVFAVMGGRWTGVLEYADYRSDRRVQLATRLTAVPGEGNRTLALRYVYREPSGDTVTSRSEHRIDTAAGRYVMEGDTFAIAALEGFGSAGGGRMVVTGTVLDNDRPEPARYTFSVTGDTLRILKETRSPWQFRNEYRLVRSAP